MRQKARVDDNQKEITTALKRIGAVVIMTHQLKNAFDILVAFRGDLFVLEIKDGAKFPKKFAAMGEEEKRTYLEGLLTAGEERCMQRLKKVNVNYHIVYDVKSAFLAIGANKPIL